MAPAWGHRPAVAVRLAALPEVCGRLAPEVLPIRLQRRLDRLWDDVSQGSGSLSTVATLMAVCGVTVDSGGQGKLTPSAANLFGPIWEEIFATL